MLQEVKESNKVDGQTMDPDHPSGDPAEQADPSTTATSHPSTSPEPADSDSTLAKANTRQKKQVPNKKVDENTADPAVPAGSSANMSDPLPATNNSDLPNDPAANVNIEDMIVMLLLDRNDLNRIHKPRKKSVYHLCQQTLRVEH